MSTTVFLWDTLQEARAFVFGLDQSSENDLSNIVDDIVCQYRTKHRLDQSVLPVVGYKVEFSLDRDEPDLMVDYRTFFGRVSSQDRN